MGDRGRPMLPQNQLSIMVTRSYTLKVLGITEEQIASAPKITTQLKMIASVIRRAGQPRVTRKIIDSNGVAIKISPTGGISPTTVVDDTRYLPPYGPGSDVERSWPWYLETSAEPDARAILEKYYSIEARAHRRSVPIEGYCLAAGVSPIRALEIITATCVRLGAQASTIIAAVNHPRVVQKTVEMALTDEGTEDRATLHKATGFLPSPKGAQTSIQIVQNAQHQSNVSQEIRAAPPPEQTIRTLVNRFNEAKTLPASVQHSVIPDILPSSDGESAVTVPASRQPRDFEDVEAELLNKSPDEEEEESMG